MNNKSDKQFLKIKFLMQVIYQVTYLNINTVEWNDTLYNKFYALYTAVKESHWSTFNFPLLYSYKSKAIELKYKWKNKLKDHKPEIIPTILKKHIEESLLPDTAGVSKLKCWRACIIQVYF